MATPIATSFLITSAWLRTPMAFFSRFNPSRVSLLTITLMKPCWLEADWAVRRLDRLSFFFLGFIECWVWERNLYRLQFNPEIENESGHRGRHALPGTIEASM